MLGGGGGGGASIVSIGSFADPANWLLVAGGGGGGAGSGSSFDRAGGDGGGLAGGDAQNGCGRGGNQDGTTGSGMRLNGSAGASGRATGGGGGGNWGGEGGAAGNSCGGGGGSGFIKAGIDGTFLPAASIGDGSVTVTYEPSPAQTPTTPNPTTPDPTSDPAPDPIAPIVPSMDITDVDIDRSEGTAELILATNTAGALRLDKTNKVRGTDWSEVGSGESRLPVVPTAEAAERLREKGHLRVNPRALFAASDVELRDRRSLVLRVD